MIRLLCLAVSLTFLSAAQQQTGIISGSVRNAWSKAPIRRAIVTLSTTGEEPYDAVTYSDENGVFGFSGVPGGVYYLCARMRGYERRCYGGSGEAGEPTAELKLRKGENRSNILLPMLPEGSVSGTVTDPDGDPLPNALVQLLHPVYKRRVLHWTQAGSAVTNDQGQYRLSYVLPGEYRVMATSTYRAVTRIQPEAINGEILPQDLYAPQFYPGSDTVSGAASLTLNAGNEVKGIDFNLTSIPQVTISGRVEIPPQMDSSHTVSISVIPKDPVATGAISGAAAGPPEHRFVVTEPAGRYQIVAFAEDDDHLYRTVLPLDATADTDNVVVPLTPASPLRGKLQLEGAGANDPASYRVELVPGDELPLAGPPPSADVNQDGTFTFDSVPPGIWDIGVRPEPEGSYVKSMRLGSQDVLTADMELKPGERPPLQIVLSMNGAAVSGNVREAGENGPVPHLGRAMVLLAPDGKWEEVLSFYQMRATDGNGHFDLKGVTPGRYKLYAFDHLQAEEFWRPGFLTSFANQGTELDLHEGSRLSADPVLIRRVSETSGYETSSN